MQVAQILGLSHLWQFKDEGQVVQPTLLLKLQVEPDWQQPTAFDG